LTPEAIEFLEQIKEVGLHKEKRGVCGKVMKILAAICGLVIFAALPLRANWGSDAGGSVGTGTFKAFGISQVEMQSEDLQIRLYRDRAKVQVDYILKNTGGAIDVKAGFPCLGLKSEKKNYVEIEDYRFSADGKDVSFKIEKGAVGNWKALFDRGFLDMAEQPDDPANEKSDCPGCEMWWLTSTVHFDKGQTKHVTVQYESLYEHSEGGYSDDSSYNNDYFRYLLSTARSWKGPIQKGRITIVPLTVDPESIVITPRNRFQKTKRGFIWEFTNLKPMPSDNIEVDLNNKFYTIFNYEAPPEDESWYSFEGDNYFFDFHGYSAKASSEVAEYPVANLSDTNKETAWVTRRNGGIGESVTLTLKKPAHVDQIGIVPGYAKSKDIYFSNNRIEQVQISINGKIVTNTTLPDEYISFWPGSKKGYQLISLGEYEGVARTITITIKKVYPGSKYRDTCISEILLRKRLKTKPDVHGAG
jgi:hypothetical protein